jgi:P-type E1-E2 ATPase
MRYDIPGYGKLDLEELVLDYNGTIAQDGALIDGVAEAITQAAHLLHIHIVTADTFGTVKNTMADLPVSVTVLRSNDHTAEKAAFIRTLGPHRCAAIGNGNNDAQMLQTAALGIAIIGPEGCATAALLQSDLACRSIAEALALFAHPKRLIATLRR